MLVFEKEARESGFDYILGIDEAGRGPLAGPVVAAAVSLKTDEFDNKITDSKKLTALQREKAFHEIFEKAYIGVGMMNESIIDSYNILEATYLAMSNAVRHLIEKLPDDYQEGGAKKQNVLLLIDGNRFKSELTYPFKTIVRGDSRSLSISCASIIAKVLRDRILLTYDKVFPQYGFVKHKGYPTKQHREAIKKFGLTDIHRKSFTVSI